MNFLVEHGWHYGIMLLPWLFLLMGRRRLNVRQMVGGVLVCFLFLHATPGILLHGGHDLGDHTLHPCCLQQWSTLTPSHSPRILPVPISFLSDWIVPGYEDQFFFAEQNKSPPAVL